MPVVLLTSGAATPPGARILHTYRSGARLVDTGDAVPPAAEEVVRGSRDVAGLRLPVAAGTLAAARESSRRMMRRKRRTEEDEAALDADGTLLGYVELHGPPDAAMTATLREAGLRVIGHQPVSSYLCRGTPEAFAAAQKLRFVAGVVALTGELKPVPRLPEDAAGVEVTVSLAAGTTAPLDGVDGIDVLAGTVEPTPTGTRVRVRLHSGDVERLRRVPAVLGVELFVPRTTEDEVADLVVAGVDPPLGDYLEWLAERGVSGSGVTVGVVDDGVDETHPAFGGRVTAGDTGAAAHGTMVAGQLGGRYLDERDAQGMAFGLGVAPDAEMISQDNQSTITALAEQTVLGTGPSGFPATIQNNSWGTGTQDPMDYGSDEATLDARVRNAVDGVPLAICFSAGNQGESGLTRPKAAKNIIVTGNSENLRPEDGGAEADDVSQVYTGSSGSSRGNCGDGRVRPDVVAPGQWTASANHGIPSGDPRYLSDRVRWGGGTSAASPKTAGACAVITEWWRRHTEGATPSPAMLRALLVNRAVDTGFGGAIPNPYQGWGRLDLGAVLADDHHRTHLDQDVLLVDPGEEHALDMQVSDPGAAMCVTLAWTDPPGPIGSGTVDVPAVVNRLALRVEVDGTTYHGNVLAGGWSVPGGDDPGTDNVQNVFLPAGTVPAGFRVVVAALAVSTDCLTGDTVTPQQDFALVVDNAHIDAGSTPGDVTVIVGAGGRMPEEPADRWAGDDDETADLQPERWADRPDASGGSDSARDEQRWWDRPPVAAPAAPTGPPPIDPGLVDALVGPDHSGRVRTCRLDDATPVGDAPHPRAVVVVDADTRFTRAALDRLRRVAFTGELHLVSAGRDALEFAVARIGRRCGVHVRLAADAAGVAAEVHRAVAALSGAQRAETTRRSGGVEFDVVEGDTRIGVVLAGNGQPKLERPDGSVVVPGTVPTRDGRMAVLDAPEPGRWRVEADGGVVGDVHVTGCCRVRARPVGAAVAVAVTGGRLTAAVGETRRAGGEATPEQEPVPVTAVSVTDPVPGEARWATVLRAPVARSAATGGGAAVDQVTVTARGTAADGRPVARAVDATAVTLEPRTARLDACRPVVTRGRVRAVVGSAVELERDGVVRRVVAREPGLRGSLAEIDPVGMTVDVAVRGDELLALVVPIAPVGGGPGGGS